MSNKQAQTLLLGSAVFGLSYLVLSQRDCQQACRALFEPLATEAGRIIASSLIAGLIASA